MKMQETIMNELEKSWNDSRKEKRFAVLSSSCVGRHSDVGDNGKPECLLVSNPNHQSSLSGVGPHDGGSSDDDDESLEKY
jgi:hypothetical protein